MMNVSTVTQSTLSANSCQYGPIPSTSLERKQFERYCGCKIYKEGWSDPLLVEEIFSKFFLTISVIGNVLVILVLNRMKRAFFSSPMKAMLQNLSLADMTVCILYNVNEAVGIDSALTTNTFCKLFGGLLWTSLSSSSCAVCCVSIERYLAVVKPLEYNLTTKKAVLMIMFSWYYSILFTTPDFYFLERVFIGPVCLQGNVAICFYSNWKGIVVSSLNLLNIVATFVIPLIIVVYTNVSIIVIMLKASKKTKMDQRSTKRKGVIMIVFLLTVIYVICSVPFTIHYILRAIPTSVEVPRNFTYVAYYLMLANSSCNPFIYSFFSADFRRECVNLISCPCRWIREKFHI